MILPPPVATTAAAPGPVDQHRWHDRLLIVFAPEASSPDLAAQRRDIAAAKESYAERDLVVVEVVDGTVIGASDDAAALRRRFAASHAAFRAVLVGKDGTVVLAAAEPLTAQRLAAVIDVMPMRRDEMRRRR